MLSYHSYHYRHLIEIRSGLNGEMYEIVNSESLWSTIRKPIFTASKKRALLTVHIWPLSPTAHYLSLSKCLFLYLPLSTSLYLFFSLLLTFSLDLTFSLPLTLSLLLTFSLSITLFTPFCLSIINLGRRTCNLMKSMTLWCTQIPLVYLFWKEADVFSIQDDTSKH